MRNAIRNLFAYKWITAILVMGLANAGMADFVHVPGPWEVFVMNFLYFSLISVLVGGAALVVLRRVKYKSFTKLLRAVALLFLLLPTWCLFFPWIKCRTCDGDGILGYYPGHGWVYCSCCDKFGCHSILRSLFPCMDKEQLMYRKEQLVCSRCGKTQVKMVNRYEVQVGTVQVGTLESMCDDCRARDPRAIKNQEKDFSGL